MTTRIKIRGRLAFAQLFAAKAFADSDPRYSCSILFEPNGETHKAVRAAIDAEAALKWGQKAPGIVKAMITSNDACLKDGNTKAQYSGFEDMFFVSASQAEDRGRPDIRNAKGLPVAAGDAGAPYSGCYVVAILDLWAQDNQYGKRVNASIAGIQFWKHGDPFGGSAMPVSDDDYEDLSAEADEDLA